MKPARRFTSNVAPLKVVGALSGALVALAGGSCSSEAPSGATASESVRGSAGSGASSAASLDSNALSAEPSGPRGSGTGVGFTVPADAEVCKESLSFSVPGCSCVPPARQTCWTGPAQKRNVGGCRDGIQTCLGPGEVGAWGPCEGEVLTCASPDGGTPAAETPVPSGACPCTPGVTIGCSEDCEALIICSLSGYKTCQPDGTWGTCRETNDPTGALGNLLGCRSVLHGCFPANEEGVYTGDCSQVFACGHAPGVQ